MDNSLGELESFWIKSTVDTKYPKLSENISADVLVVGGGIVGVTTALLLKEAGKSVVLVEANKVIKDVTGHTTAKVTSLHGYIYKHLLDTVGFEKAKIYARANQSAIEFIAENVEKRNIDCDFTRIKAYTYTEELEMLGFVKDEVEAAKKLGLPASFTDKTDLPFQVKGAVYFNNQAQFHPRRYLLALAEEFTKNGGKIFENTRVKSLKEENGKVLADTGKNIIEAKSVVIATHFPFFDRGRFYTKLYPRRSYVLGVYINGELPKGVYYSHDKDIRSMRCQQTEKGSMLFVGGEGHKAGQVSDTLARYQNLEKYARERFDVKSIDYHWSTQDNDTPDGIPYIGKSPGSEHIYLASGFGGWGMTNGTAAANIIKDLILGNKNEWASLFDPERPLKTTKRFFSEGFNVFGRYADRYLSRSKEKIDDIEKGEGVVINIDNKKEAVYRDDEGRTHAISPFCTHMNCQVNWNNAERTWDCPCHGSRFDKNGKVIHGPALRDLK